MSERTAFERVREIIAECQGLDPARISMDTDLWDLGIHGDDGDDLFAAFDNEFKIDWASLDLGIHFGNEGFGLPMPWHMKGNCALYKRSPCLISNIVQAVESGRWPGTDRVLRPKLHRIALYLLSGIWPALILGIIVAAIWAFFAKYIG